MLINYLKIAYRNLLKHKAFSLINILGLAVGMTACLFIFQYVNFERSYDDFHVLKDQIYRVEIDRYHEGQLQSKRASGYTGVGPALQEEVPGIVNYARLLPLDGIISYEASRQTSDKQTFREEHIAFVDSTFLSMFSFAPELENALNTPSTVILSASAATKYFGEEYPVGKTLIYNHVNLHDLSFKVAGIFPDMPRNSHMQFDMLFSYQTLFPYRDAYAFDWNVSMVYTYIQVDPKVELTAIKEKLSGVVEKYKGDQMVRRNMRYDLVLQPLTDIHLTSNLVHELQPNGDAQTVYFLSIIALLVIVIAWINYVNLSTARWMERAKEVGVRKVVGASKAELFKQFILEAVLLNALAIILAITLIQLLSPFFQFLLGQQLQGGFWLQSQSVWVLLILLMGGAIIAGTYPAWMLSSLRAKDALKNKLTAKVNRTAFRKGLIGFQFTVAIGLIAGTLAITGQTRYMRSQQLGFNPEQLLILRGPEMNAGTDSLELQKMTTFKKELEGLSAVASITTSNTVPGTRVNWNGAIHRQGTGAEEGKDYGLIATDENYLNTYQLQLLAGNNFKKEHHPAVTPIIINKMAMEQLGIASPEEAIGQKVVQSVGEGVTFEIVGVIENFHQASLKETFFPLILIQNPGAHTFYTVQLETQNLPENMKLIEETWQQVFADQPFDYFFLDEFFNQQYQQDQQFGSTFGVFSVLAILIACMGLFGLVSFMINKKTKEIGIRKVLGASVQSIVQLLTQDFLKIMLVAGCLALPLTYWGITWWLEQYAFRMEPGLMLFLLPLALVTLIVLFTISFQTIRAALANPVKSLRNE